MYKLYNNYCKEPQKSFFKSKELYPDGVYLISIILFHLLQFCLLQVRIFKLQLLLIIIT